MIEDQHANAPAEANGQSKCPVNPESKLTSVTKIVKPFVTKRIRNKAGAKRFRFLRGNRVFPKAAKENNYFNEQQKNKLKADGTKSQKLNGVLNEVNKDEELENYDVDNSDCSDVESVLDDGTIVPLRFSPFPLFPPYLNFSMHDQKVSELPPLVKRYLRWKLSPITPVVVRKTVINSGFRVIKEPKDWIGIWGKHMKSMLFSQISIHQKVNHFPGTFQIGRKDRLWRNVQKMVAKYGIEEFNFLPQTFVLPHDLRLLRQTWRKNDGETPWIIKPPASARGTGIQVIHQWSQLPKKRPLVVQSYVKDPYLINGRKFDIRLYVFVTSIDPLRIYLYDNGLVRFASMAYSNEMDTLSDNYVHLTNYSINKTCEEYVANDDADACQGHKWTLHSLWGYLKERNVDVAKIKSDMKDIVIKTLLSVESQLCDMSRANVTSRYGCYELFGFDVLLDTNFKPWLLEVNISPSLHSTSSLDLSVKGPLVRDVFNMARYHFPDNMNSQAKLQLAQHIEECYPDEVCEKLADKEQGAQYCLDTSLYFLANENVARHEFFENQVVHKRDGETNGTTPSTSIFDSLTKEDLFHLCETEDEASQSQGFVRVFPSHGSESYFRFMDKVRYRNLLLNEWQKKFGDSSDRHAAIEFLQQSLKQVVLN